MASPTLPYCTYRLTNIPGTFTNYDLRRLFSSDDQKAILYSSLVPATYRHSGSVQVGTVTFKEKPEGFKDGHLRFSPANPTLITLLEASSVEIDDHFHGLTPLNEGSLGDKTVDIVAVTGLAEKAFASWQAAEGSMWLRDFLPQDVENIRVSIFGYSSELFESNFNAGLLNYTKIFLQTLQNSRNRKTGRRRPLILIGHSLGCLIIKQALINCAESKGGIDELYCSIYSVVFFGAPHRGLSTFALESLVQGKPPERLVRDLKRGSTLLTTLNESFPSASKDIKIITCYELRETPTTKEGADGRWGRTGPLTMMVEKDSACLYTINKYTIPINENHSRIAKLSSGPESSYHVIKGKLLEHVHEAPAAIQGRFQQIDSAEMILNVYYLAHFVYQVICGDSDRHSHTPLRQFIKATLDHEIFLLKAFHRLLSDEELGRILNRPETPSRYAARVFDILQNLNRLFLSYSNLTLGYYIPYQHFLHSKRQRRLEVEEDEKGLLSLSVDLQNTAGSERLFEEAELTSLVMQSRDWIEKIKEAVSFAMLGIADLQSLKLFGESPTAKRTGLDKVAVRQVMNRSQVVDDLEPLQGHLEGSPYTSPKSGLQLMRFLSECEPEGLDVVVEFKSYRQPILGQSNVNPSELAEQRLHSTNLVKRTIRNLAALLYKSSFGMDSADSILARSYPVLCTFNCIGYLDQPEEEHMAFIFQLPTMPSTTVLENIFTLHAFIDRVDETKNPAEALPLEQRFLLAHSLCLTVLNLHSSGWVHKNIRSQNIVLFPTPLLDAPNESRSTKTSRFVPYLKGFEFSRPALGRSDGLSTFDMMSNLYRHPERQGKPTANFSKEHDLYALGVVLLEVGIGKTVTKRYQPRLEASKHSGKYLTPEDIRDKFIVKMAEMELPKAMGSKYTRAVVRCLRGDFGVERDDKQQTELGLTFQELVIDAVEEGLQL